MLQNLQPIKNIMQKTIYVVLKSSTGAFSLYRFSGTPSQIKRVRENKPAPEVFVRSFYGPTKEWIVVDIVFGPGHDGISMLDGLMLMNPTLTQMTMTRLFEAGYQAGR